MIEPHSAHDGASAWVWKLTLVAPSDIVIAPVLVPPPPPPFPLATDAEPVPFAACPLARALVAIPLRSSRGSASAGDSGGVAEAEAFSGSSPCEGIASEAVGGATASEASGCAPGLDVEPPDAEVALAPVGASAVEEMAGRVGAAGTSMADRSISPSVAFSSVDRNREPSHRKM